MTILKHNCSKCNMNYNIEIKKACKNNCFTDLILVDLSNKHSNPVEGVRMHDTLVDQMGVEPMSEAPSPVLLQA